ncbi:MAG: hypothetical protein ISS56_14715 [Anaerolineae bacterium]|nr:hypothetical protein [Anaerolineae bacterium]
MIQERVWTRVGAPAVSRTPASREDSIHKHEILRLLERAANDDGFVAQMTYRGDEALRGYCLSAQEKAALLSGDIVWTEARIGKLTLCQST